MDEYLKGITEREPRAEKAPKEEWLASYNGFSIYEDSRLANGWIELRDEKGEVLARINNVKAVHVAKGRRI
jgi:hypothetical protein